MSRPERVWYAAFGSNLWSERFRVYLEGGTAKDSHGSSPGARDATPPTKSETRFCAYQLMFGGVAARWSGGGVAFLGSERGDHHTALRLYNVTAEQYEDVVKQENAMDATVDVDFGRAVAESYLDVVPNRYGRVLHLGQHEDGFDIFTITTSSAPEINAPHHTYVRTIANGLLETHDGSSFDMADLAAVRRQLELAAGMANFSNGDWAHVAE
ncbi:MAG: hypothetical protein ACI81L_002676 [Verrucomicrobiales bacterium]|jgi:hypothetical protein